MNTKIITRKGWATRKTGTGWFGQRDGKGLARRCLSPAQANGDRHVAAAEPVPICPCGKGDQGKTVVGWFGEARS